ncbi:hypothetical protein [Streptomyces termitum]|uniref:hypothetical protein n=1 Tax=Streptomyces termitum TaxID=67368 RepID=UPI00378C3B9B
MNDTPGRNAPGSSPSDDQDGSAPRWSADRPPAGPTPPPGHGWGAPPPYPGGPYGYGAPPAARPGVIPLRPLTVGEMLEASITTLRRYWRVVLPVTVSVSVFTQAALVPIQRHLGVGQPVLHPDASPAEQMDAASEYLRSAFVSYAPSMLISIAAGVFTAAMLTVVLSRAVLGRPVTLGEAWREASPRLPALLLLSLALPVGAAALSLVAMAPGLLLGGAGGVLLAFLGGTGAFLVSTWLLIRFSLASPALMLERQGIVAALKRSAKLVRGAWWRVFGITLLTQLLIVLFTVLLTIPFTAVAFSIGGVDVTDLAASGFEKSWTYLIVMGIGGVVAGALTYPVAAGVTVLLYVDQRIRREALDLELSKAAGL